MMIDLIFYIFAAFGLSYIVGHSAITLRSRAAIHDHGGLIGRGFVNLLECPACFAFHVGWVASLIAVTPFSGNFIAWGLFTAGTNFALAKITRLVD